MTPPPPPGTYRAVIDFAGLLAEFDLAMSHFKPLPVSPAELVERARTLNYPHMVATALDRQAYLLSLTDKQAAWDAYQAALAQAEIADDADTRVRILTHMAMLEHMREHDETSRAYLKQARSLADLVKEAPHELLIAEVTVAPELFTPATFRQRVAPLSPVHRAMATSSYLIGLQKYDALAALAPLARELSPTCLAIGGTEAMLCASLIAQAHIRTGFARTALAWGQHAHRLFYASKSNELTYAQTLTDPLSCAIGFGMAHTELTPAAATSAIATQCHDPKLCERLQSEVAFYGETSAAEVARLKAGLDAGEATYARQVAFTHHEFGWMTQLLQRFPAVGRPPRP